MIKNSILTRRLFPANTKSKAILAGLALGAAISGQDFADSVQQIWQMPSSKERQRYDREYAAFEENRDRRTAAMRRAIPVKQGEWWFKSGAIFNVDACKNGVSVQPVHGLRDEVEEVMTSPRIVKAKILMAVAGGYLSASEKGVFSCE